jgi:hypothetical protein
MGETSVLVKYSTRAPRFVNKGRRGGLTGVLTLHWSATGWRVDSLARSFQINLCTVLPKEPLWINVIGTFVMVPLITQKG